MAQSLMVKQISPRLLSDITQAVGGTLSLSRECLYAIVTVPHMEKLCVTDASVPKYKARRGSF